jgi:hypothetical protein
VSWWVIEVSMSLEPSSCLGKRGWLPVNVSFGVPIRDSRLALGVHGNGPVHEVEIYVRCLEQIQTLLQTLLSTGVECAPELAGNEQVLPLHNSSRDDILERLADLVFVLVAEGTVNVSVTTLDSVDNGLLDLARRRLPRSESQSGDGRASVEGDSSVHFGLWVEDTFGCTFEHKLGESGIHRDSVVCLGY